MCCQTRLDTVGAGGKGASMPNNRMSQHLIFIANAPGSAHQSQNKSGDSNVLAGSEYPEMMRLACRVDVLQVISTVALVVLLLNVKHEMLLRHG